MVNGALNDRTAARDFGFEQRDPRIELRHRKRVEILARQQGGGIVGAAGKIVFHTRKVGRHPGDVKQMRRYFGAGGCDSRQLIWTACPNTGEKPRSSAWAVAPKSRLRPIRARMPDCAARDRVRARSSALICAR
jgi:hypothetical protein